MTSIRPDVARMNGHDAAQHAMDNDISDLFADAEIITERRPAKIVTALRIDLGIQSALESAAAAQGIGTSTLMRLIIEEWVHTQQEAEPVDQLDKLVRHLDAARQAASSLAHRAA